MIAFVGQLIVVFILSALSIGGYAHNKVVVIPMAGDDEPFAPITANSPVQGNYTIYADTVIDNITGLEWQRSNAHNVSPFSSWAEASTYCDGLDLEGKSDWRLPQYHELQSIVAYDEHDPAINEIVFPSTMGRHYWSASDDVDNSNYAWIVGFYAGRISAGTKSNLNTNSVRCVRSYPPAGPIFKDNDNGTVTDLATGLTWQQLDDGSFRNQSDAIDYCEALSLDGGGWRLPEIKELSSIVDLRTYNPSVDLRYFPNTKLSSYYWSASRYAYVSSYAWNVNFSSGIVNPDADIYTITVRCVR